MSKILVVDDSGLVRTLLRRQLEPYGFDVTEAVDGADAMGAVRAQKPDVVLLDVELPDMDGYAVLKAIKSDPETATTTVVFVTSRTDTADVVRALEMGAHDYLRKPFEQAELLARVGAAMRVRALHSELERRNAELEVVARVDTLTRLPNRRHGEELLQSLVSASRRHHQPLSVLMVDVDRFKAINDRYGHLVGDGVLVEVATRLQDCLRLEDDVARWGGEEFLVLLPATDARGAATTAERLRCHVSTSPIPLDGGVTVPVTISIGCASGGSEHAEQLLRRADRALYAAKGDGRNRVASA